MDSTAVAPALLSIERAVAFLTLDRPGTLNAIDPIMAETLGRLALEVEANPDIRVLVIRGSGRAFCAGGDVGAFLRHIDEIDGLINQILDQHHAFLATLRRMPQLVLTSVHGAVAGAGFSLAFMGDMTIAADTTRFTPAYRKLGVSPDGGGTVGVVRAVGPRRAMQIFLAEETFTAMQAADWGLVNVVVPAGTLEAETKALAAAIAETAPEAIAATKRLVHLSSMNTTDDQLEAERAALLACMNRPHFSEAVRKFASDRNTKDQ